MDYFGTNLTEHGHYRFELKENTMVKLYYDFDKFPFHPEYLTNNLSKGEIIFYKGGGYTVLGISGSCKDSRPGTKSIFWLKGNLTFSELKERIMNIPIAKNIIDKMPFDVKW